MHPRRLHARARGLVDDGRDGMFPSESARLVLVRMFVTRSSVDRFDEKYHEFAGLKSAVGRLAIDTSDDGQEVPSLGVHEHDRRASDGDRAFRGIDHPSASRRIRLGEHVFGEFRRGDGDAQVHVPEPDTVTVRDVLDKHGGFMEGAVEELLGISRAKRGMGGGSGLGSHRCARRRRRRIRRWGRSRRPVRRKRRRLRGWLGRTASVEPDGRIRARTGRKVRLDARARHNNPRNPTKTRNPRLSRAPPRRARPAAAFAGPLPHHDIFSLDARPAALPGVVRARFPSGTRVPVCKMCQLTFPTRAARSQRLLQQPASPRRRAASGAGSPARTTNLSRAPLADIILTAAAAGTSAADDDDDVRVAGQLRPTFTPGNSAATSRR